MDGLIEIDFLWFSSLQRDNLKIKSLNPYKLIPAHRTKYKFYLAPRKNIRPGF